MAAPVAVLTAAGLPRGGPLFASLRAGLAARPRTPKSVPVATTFSPSPRAPTPWAPLADARDLAPRHRNPAGASSKVGNASPLHDVQKWAYLQVLLARGHRRMEGLFGLALAAGGDRGAACRTWHLNTDFFV